MFSSNALFLLILLFPLIAAPAIAEETIYKTEQNILYRDDTEGNLTDYMRERCRLDLYYPAEGDAFATIVWFHGGGLTAGEKYIPEELRDRGFAVAAVNYRLSPRVSAPAYIDDAAAATAWVMKNIENYGGDPGLVFISGHSAGGYLSAMVGLDTTYLQKYDIDADRLAGIIPFSGHMITHFTVRQERGIPRTQTIVDDLAPLYHVRPDAPPFILVTGDREQEMLGRYQENALMATMMAGAGHTKTRLFELNGFNHVDMVAPACLILVKEVNAIIQERQEQ